MEREQKYRQSETEIITKATIEETKRGKDYGLLVTVLLIGAALFAGWLGNQVLAGILAGAPALGLVTKFIDGRDKNTHQNRNPPD